MSTVATSSQRQLETRLRRFIGPVTEIPGDLIAFGAASTGFAHVALATAPGTVHPAGSSPGTLEVSFIHEGWWLASLLLYVPLFFFTRRWRSIWLGTLGAAVLAAPQFWATEVNLDRWSRSGQGDGLEQLATFIPWCMFVVFLVAAVVGRIAAAIAANDCAGHADEAA
jgi:hypothetical protein